MADAASFVVAVDKPAGPTSHDVVAWARRAFGTRAVGHAGTLDPAATGVLVLAIGEATKLVPYLTLDDKEYEATVVLGEETTTLDAEGEVVARAPAPPGLDVTMVEAAGRAFLGLTRQRAPVVSAIKQGGVPLHERVRRGEDVEAPEREVVMHAFRALHADRAELRLHVHVGKGFYVRSFARDLARALGTVGHLRTLRRTRSGAFVVEQAVPGELLRRARDPAARAELEAAVLLHRRDLVAALPHLPALVVDAALERDARHGKPVAHPGVSSLDEDAACLLVAEEPEGHRRLVAIARRAGEHARVVRGFSTDQAAGAR
jgi:tRNA pseudouridine55 synthase